MRVSTLTAILCVVAATRLVAAPATSADPGGWRNARWGMTEDEVLKAEPSAKRIDSIIQQGGEGDGWTEYISIQTKGFQLAATTFTANFVFDRASKKLKRVYLSCEDLQAPANAFDSLEQGLTEKYGAPAFENGRRAAALNERTVSWQLPKTSIELIYHRTSVGALFILDYSSPEAHSVNSESDKL